jgi:hypothetical protein
MKIWCDNKTMSKSFYTPALPNEDVHPDEVYTSEMHEANDRLLANYAGTLGVESHSGVITPWMMTDKGVARVQVADDAYKAQIVETKPPGYFGLAAHDVKHAVELGPKGLAKKTHTKVYLPVHQHLGILFMNQPISAGMMMGYPTLDYNPQGVSKALKAHLHNPEDQIIADRTSLSRLLARNAWMIRNWLSIKI